MACPMTVIWAAAVGSTLLGYQLFFDGQTVYTGSETRGEICIDDDQIHTLKVIAIFPDGVTTSSDNIGTLTQLRPPGWVPSSSPTITPIATPTPTPIAIPVPILGCSLPVAVCLDVNRDGVIGWDDFVIFSMNFRARNDGVKEVGGE